MSIRRDKQISNLFEIKILNTDEVIYTNRESILKRHAESIDEKLAIIEKIEDALEALF